MSRLSRVDHAAPGMIPAEFSRRPGQRPDRRRAVHAPHAEGRRCRRGIAIRPVPSGHAFMVTRHDHLDGPIRRCSRQRPPFSPDAGCLAPARTSFSPSPKAVPFRNIRRDADPAPGGPSDLPTAHHRHQRPARQPGTSPARQISPRNRGLTRGPVATVPVAADLARAHPIQPAVPLAPSGQVWGLPAGPTAISTSSLAPASTRHTSTTQTQPVGHHPASLAQAPGQASRPASVARRHVPSLAAATGPGWVGERGNLTDRPRRVTRRATTKTSSERPIGTQTAVLTGAVSCPRSASTSTPCGTIRSFPWPGSAAWRGRRQLLAHLEHGDQFATLAVAEACDRVLGAGGKLVRSVTSLTVNAARMVPARGGAARRSPAATVSPVTPIALVTVVPLHASRPCTASTGCGRSAAESRAVPGSGRPGAGRQGAAARGGSACRRPPPARAVRQSPAAGGAADHVSLRRR